MKTCTLHTKSTHAFIGGVQNIHIKLSLSLLATHQMQQQQQPATSNIFTLCLNRTKPYRKIECQEIDRLRLVPLSFRYSRGGIVSM